MYDVWEAESIIRPDGEEFALNDGARRTVISITGRGAAGVEYVTVRGYQAQTENVLSWLLQPRAVGLELTWAVEDRDAYWQARQQLQAFLRPNLGGALCLRHVRSDGTRRDLYVYPDSTPEFDDLDFPQIDAALHFIAYDPTFYDPTAHVLTLTAAGLKTLYFPWIFDVPTSNYVTNGDFSNDTTGWTAVNCAIYVTSGVLYVNTSAGTWPADVYREIDYPVRPGDAMRIAARLGNSSFDNRYVDLRLRTAGGQVIASQSYTVGPLQPLTEVSFTFEVEDYAEGLVVEIHHTAGPTSGRLQVDDVSVTVTALPDNVHGIVFGDEWVIGDPQTIQYTGEFAAYPRIEATGPYTRLTITNDATGKRIRLGQPIAAGETRYIILTPGAQTITRQDPDTLTAAERAADSRFDELLLPDSDLVGFNIRPAGIPWGNSPYEGVPDGVNVLRVEAEGHDAATTQVVIRYLDRFLSVA